MDIQEGLNVQDFLVLPSQLVVVSLEYASFLLHNLVEFVEAVFEHFSDLLLNRVGILLDLFHLFPNQVNLSPDYFPFFLQRNIFL